MADITHDHGCTALDLPSSLPSWSHARFALPPSPTSPPPAGPPTPLLDPTNDLVFKLLLTRRPELLVDMLEGILAHPVLGLELLDPELPGELPHDKHIVLDVRARLANRSRADVEMQVRTHTALPSRLVYYAARDYANQLRRGDGYQQLTPTIVAVWLVEPLFADLKRLHSIFELRDRHTNTRLTDQLSIHLLQLSSLSRRPAAGYDAVVQRWARFLLADPTDLRQLAAEDPTMSIAKDTLEQLSEDPEVRRLAREREDSVKLYEMSLAASRAEGEAKGRADVLLKLLQLRFGPLPANIQRRLATASSEQLDTWVEKVLTLESPHELLS